MQSETFLTQFLEQSARDKNRDISARYSRMRETSREVNHDLARLVPQQVINEHAKKLGILKRGTLMLKSEVELTIFFDYCIHWGRHKGRNAVETLLVKSPPEPDSRAMACLKAMQHASYIVMIVESIERRLGLNVRNMVTGETMFLADFGLSSSAEKGDVLASHILTFEGFAMTTGASILLFRGPDDRRLVFLEGLRARYKFDARGGFDPALLLREYLRSGLSRHMGYTEN